MAAEFPHLIQTTMHIFPWIMVPYLAIRALPNIALAFTHVIATVVALFHRAPQRRRDAREVLNRHPFTRRR